MPHSYPAFLSPIPGPLRLRGVTREARSKSAQPIVASAEKNKQVATGVAAAAVLAAAIISSTPIDESRLPLIPIIPPAHAAKGGGDTFLSASGQVIKDPESLLRWSLPISNKTVRDLQSDLEAAINDTKGLKWTKIDNHVKRAQLILKNQTAKILVDIPEQNVDEASQLLVKVSEEVPMIESALIEKNAEKLIKTTKQVLRNVGQVEQLMVVKFPFDIPTEYSNLPRLMGRATVEVLVKKGEDESFDIEGVIYKEGRMTLVLDGYSAPLSAGTFVDLVNKGFYDNSPILRSDGFVVQAGKPKSGEGYVDKDSGKVRQVPLEMLVRGDKGPTYGVTLEDDGRGTAVTTLPFTSYGTLALAREEFEANTASSQFFWFLFEPDLTPAGRNLMDGSWASFGYTTNGEKFLRGLQKGDRIISAKVVDGLQNLVS